MATLVKESIGAGPVCEYTYYGYARIKEDRNGAKESGRTNVSR